MLWWNYYLCVTTDPGRVPDSWVRTSRQTLHKFLELMQTPKQPDTQSGDGYEVKKLTGSPRFCRSCEKYKPPRAHHCKVCNRCVLPIHLDSGPKLNS
jgi:predicted metal-binding protein